MFIRPNTSRRHCTVYLSHYIKRFKAKHTELALKIWTAVLSVVIGLVLSSAFSAIVVLAQELVPTKIGMISGVFFGLMFGISGIAAAGLGAIADATSIEYMFDLCAFLPLIGMVTVLLPGMKRS